jgi:predicted permease
VGSWRPDRYAELRSFLRRSRRRNRFEEEVDEELRQHVEMRTADNIAAGMSQTEAQEDARRRFGDYARFRSETAEVDRSTEIEERRMEVLDTLKRSVEQAVRSMITLPSFAIVAILTLAIGMGGTIAVFALLDSVILNPLPYDNANRLVYVSSSVPKLSADGDWGVSVAGYFHFRNRQTTLREMGAFTTEDVNVTGAGGTTGAERAPAAFATATLFSTLGAGAREGRLINADDDRPGAARVVVLGSEYARKHYGGQRAVGQTMRINGEPVQIIGVAENGFELPDQLVDLWLPLALDASAPPVNSHYLHVVGALREGVTFETASADFARLTADLPARFPSAYSAGFMRESGFGTRIVPLRDHVTGGVAHVLWMLLAAVALVLLIACANVANLFLVRTESRRREIALRSALGATRGRIALHYVIESLALCSIAAAAALFLANVGLHLLVARPPAGIPRLNEVHLGGRAVLFAVACAVMAGVVFGLFPLARRWFSYDALRDGGRTSTASRSRNLVRSTLVIAQVALSLLLLSGAGLMIRSYRALAAADPGFDPNGVITFEVDLPQSTYDSPAKNLAFFRDLSARISGMAGVKHVGVGNYVPLRGDRSCGALSFESTSMRGEDIPPCVFVATAAPGYFEAMGLRVKGRTLDWRDADVRGDAVLVTDAFAKRFWPGQDPIGQGIGPRDIPPFYHVVGVVEKARDGALSEPDIEGVFYPVVPMEGAAFWGGGGATTVVVRTSLADPLTMMGTLRNVLTDIDPDVPLANPRTMRQIVSHSMQLTTFIMMLLTIAATVSVALSAVGLYGVISYSVDLRRSEMGVRLALGARLSQIRGLVLRHSMVLTLSGIAIGLAASLVATRAIASLLYGVATTDVMTSGVVSLLLVAVAALATWIPAARAARVEPMQVLRDE